MRTSATTVVGELLLTLGLIVLLFAGYELWGTDLVTSRVQDELSGDLQAEWSAPAAPVPGPAQPPVPGRPFLKIHVPAFGDGYSRAVLEGVGPDVLAGGPGHYPGTALPGAIGNVAIAGHRVGHGGPFNDLDTLRSCDAVVLETRETWWIYRVLPMADEQAGWAARQGGQARCQYVSPMAEPYTATSGAEVVQPSQTEVIEPVPHRAGVAPTAALLTLTTCNPRFSAQERLIIHGVLVTHYDKAGQPAGWAPAELSGA